MTQKQATIYDVLLAAGIDCSSHWQSDLYVLSSPEVLNVIVHYKKANPNEALNLRFFTSTSGARMIELPFSYMPFWLRS